MDFFIHHWKHNNDQAYHKSIVVHRLQNIQSFSSLFHGLNQLPKNFIIKKVINSNSNGPNGLKHTKKKSLLTTSAPNVFLKCTTFVIINKSIFFHIFGESTSHQRSMLFLCVIKSNNFSWYIWTVSSFFALFILL